MNVLILTGHFGWGHVSAAEAIRDEILEKHEDAQVEIVDMFAYLSPELSKGMYSLFNFWTRYTPQLYNRLNAVSCHMKSVPLDRATSRKIDTLLTEKKIDLVISTLPYCSQCMSTYKKIHKSTLPLYTYITDIVAHEEWVAPQTDGYFVGADSTKECLVAHGVDPRAIVVCGIPVRRAFHAAEKTVTPAERPEIVIMGGGLGLIPASETFLVTLAEQDQAHVTIITGKNAKLKKRLKEQYPQFEVVGFTRHTEKYLKRATVLVTKSGGITTFEAINTQTPLFILKPFLAQEVGNAAFIEQEGIGVVQWQLDRFLAHRILSLATNPARLKTISQRMAALKATWDSGSCLRDQNALTEERLAEQCA